LEYFSDRDKPEKSAVGKDDFPEIRRGGSLTWFRRSIGKWGASSEKDNEKKFVVVRFF